ncbi:MAG: selenide, water dikinase SelD [Myxococcales bacterium]|nr:selenide, water dikinase SelD [Myxococcales bacterium]
MAVRLTKTAKRAGCAAKQPPGYLLPLLQRLPPITDPMVMVGSATADDAAVYRLDDERALVLTTDFFTPIVDDPFDFGAVAAANALSDVYAMGGRPLTALNLVGFPAELEVEILGEILRGGAHKAREAGIDLVGGHTIKSEEPIYGLAVTGVVHPDRVVSNAGGRPGDRLVLTKPLGTGIVTTAAKNDEDTRGAISEAIAVMATLNRAAAEAMTAVGVGEGGVHAATDVTGFGLLGHLRNVVAASGCGAVVERSRVPALEAAVAYVAQGIAPGGTHANRRFLEAIVDWGEGIGEPDQLLLCDAQTSGGLLVAVAPERTEALLDALRERGVQWAVEIGELVAEPAGRIAVR